MSTPIVHPVTAAADHDQHANGTIRAGRALTPRVALAWAGQFIVLGVFAAFGPFAKLAGDPTSINLFSALGVEPFGRYGVGIAELLAMVLIVIPRTAWAGASLSLGLFAGAIFGHITRLGVALEHVEGGEQIGPVLFIAAVVGLAASAAVIAARRRELPVIGQRIP